MSLVSGIPAVEERGDAPVEGDPLDQNDNRFGIGGQRRTYRLGKYGIGNLPPDAGPVGGAAATTPASATSGSLPIRPSEVTSGGPMPQPVNATPAPAAMSRVAAPPQAPQMDTNELQRRREAVDKYSKPLDRTDPQYKMGIGQRLLRIGSDLLSGGLPGVLRSAIDPNARGYYGKGAVNSKYGIDESNRQNNLEAAQTQMKDFDTAYDEQLKGYKEQLASYDKGVLAQEREAKANKYDNTVDQNTLAPDDPAHPEGAWHGTTPGGQQKTGLPAPKWWQQQNAKEDTSEKLNAQFDARSKAADKLGLKGAERTYYIANGRLREPATPRQPTELELWGDAFKRDNGREPTADEIANRKPRAGHVKDRQSFETHWGQRFQNEAEKPYTAARAAILKQYGADKSVKAYNDNADAINQALAPYEATREQSKARLQAEKDAEAEQYGIYNRQSASPAGRQPSSQANSDKMISVQIPGHPPGQIAESQREAFLKKYPNATVNYQHYATNSTTKQRAGSNDGKNWFDVKTGKPVQSELTADEAREYLRRAGGNKDVARRMARSDGRVF